MAQKRIGEFLVEKKVLTPAQVEEILEYGKRERLRFGEAGAKLGLLSEDKMVRVFGKHYRVDFFHLEPEYLLKQSLLSLDTMVRYGVLPLGFKKDYGIFKRGHTLNLGMLDPGRVEAIKAAEEETSKSSTESSNERTVVTKTRVFLVLADQFMDVLEKVYGVNRAEIQKRAHDQIEPTLELFLEEAH